MAWSPRHIDRPLRFLYDPEVWGIGFVVMGLLILAGSNTTFSVVVMLAVCAGIQKIVDHHKPGYIIHFFYHIGLLRIFCSYGRYRF